MHLARDSLPDRSQSWWWNSRRGILDCNVRSQLAALAVRQVSRSLVPPLASQTSRINQPLWVGFFLKRCGCWVYAEGGVSHFQTSCLSRLVMSRVVLKQRIVVSIQIPSFQNCGSWNEKSSISFLFFLPPLVFFMLLMDWAVLQSPIMSP